MIRVYAYFVDAGTYTAHRFPVGRRLPDLHALQLIPRTRSSDIRKRSQIFERRSDPDDRLRDSVDYIHFYI